MIGSLISHAVNLIDSILALFAGQKTKRHQYQRQQKRYLW